MTTPAKPPTALTIGAWLNSASRQLKIQGIATARLDCLVLLSDELNLNQAAILAHTGSPLAKSSRLRLDKQIAARSAHLPLAYIRGKSEFYGRQFYLNRYVLQPRPESETMIEMLISWLAKTNLSQPTIADIGCGSGALGISAGLEVSSAKIILADISNGALRVAARNSASHGQKSIIIKSNLLLNVPSPVDVLLCNLPYVPTNFKINRAAGYEPKLAIFGGADGLLLYRRLFKQLLRLGRQPQLIFTESLPSQHHSLQTIAATASYKEIAKSDFVQLFSPAG